jgi:uncharacterized GH25 family protein
MKFVGSLLPILRRCSLVAMVLVLRTAMLSAHDMWIEPTAFLPDAGKIIGLRLRVGQDFLGDPLPHNSALIDQFVSLDASGRKPVVGREGADPAGLIRVADSGLVIIGYKSHPSPVVLPAAKFNQYLKEEGLDAITELRARRNQTDNDAREVFVRCAKSLIFAGISTDAKSDRALGFPLELTALQNPYMLRAGQELPVSLTFEGRALPGALVVAMNRQNPSARVMARTDGTGRAALKLSQAGAWLIKAVHMIPAPEGSNADWASFWASLTFELKGAGTKAAAQ